MFDLKQKITPFYCYDDEAERVMEAMMQMVKLDMVPFQRAYDHA